MTIREKIKKFVVGDEPGQILNHSEKELFVVETDMGQAFVRKLGPKRKSPRTVDADGFKRADGQAILFHTTWWKFLSGTRVDIYQMGDDLLIPVGALYPVQEKEFGDYKFLPDENWGEKLTYVKEILKDKKGKTTGYVIDGGVKLTVGQAIQLTERGELDNVVVVENKRGTKFLRTKKNKKSSDNLT